MRMCMVYVLNVCVHVNTYTGQCGNVEARGEYLGSYLIICHSIPPRQDLSLNLELGWQPEHPSGPLVCMPTELQVHAAMPSFSHGCCGSEPSSSCSPSKSSHPLIHLLSPVNATFTQWFPLFVFGERFFPLALGLEPLNMLVRYSINEPQSSPCQHGSASTHTLLANIPFAKAS